MRPAVVNIDHSLHRKTILIGLIGVASNSTNRNIYNIALVLHSRQVLLKCRHEHLELVIYDKVIVLIFKNRLLLLFIETGF